CNKSDDPVTNTSVYQGTWSGTFSGDDSGTWTANIDKDGIATGSAYSTVYSTNYTLNGSVNLNNGEFTATVGEASTGAKFIGSFSQIAGEGTWTNETYNLSGVWEGSIEK
ncbi:MAG: hypothetical protein ACWA42_03065, partial [Lutibacter sp.]